MNCTSFTSVRSGTMKKVIGQFLFSLSTQKPKIFNFLPSMPSRESTKQRMKERSRSKEKTRKIVTTNQNFEKLVTLRILNEKNKKVQIRTRVNLDQQKNKCINTTTQQMRQQAKRTTVLEMQAGWRTDLAKTITATIIL